jgi:hypothetical protein
MLAIIENTYRILWDFSDDYMDKTIRSSRYKNFYNESINL